ncbi:hypothetical protein E4T56_gene15563 [Termitomyces sp. T112]|nr:hypothetical protein E4T56_gene15563 [Termitomyces sp. T112]
MPPDLTRTTTRRPPRRFTEEELKDIELKRIKGDSSFGVIRKFHAAPAQEEDAKVSVRVVSSRRAKGLADTDQLHKKIAEMSHRIRQLEDALAILQSTVSDQRHPLLEDDLLKVKFGPEAQNRQQPFSPEAVEQNFTQSIDAFGTLTLGNSGDVKYFGRSAGSEAGEESDDEDAEEETLHTSMSVDVKGLLPQFPFSRPKLSTSVIIAYLESHLPSQERAYTLGDTYIKHASNFFRPIKQDELFNSFLPGIYKAAAVRHSQNESPSSSETAQASPDAIKNSPHALATLFFLFALGALLDLSLPPYNAEAEHYYELGHSALGLRVTFDSPQLDTVQALGLMATYHCFAGKKFHRDSAWCVMSFAMKIAQGIGLHRDSARWKMDPKTVQKRRTLFWEVFTADVSHSLALGRPPAMHLSYIDCEFPIDEEATLNDKGEIQNGFWRMKYTFGRDLFLAVSDATLVAKSPSYSTILEIDRKVREVTFPTSFKPYVTREDGDDIYYSSSHSLQGFYASQHRTVTMIYLHRSFFAQAMLDHPTNPLLSPFAPSFLTAFRSASVIIRASAHQFDRCAEMAMRAWFLMYHTFSAGIIVGTVVTRSPSSDMAPGALQDLCRAVELFERTAKQSERAKIALGVLHRLKEKAVRVYSQHKSNSIPVQPSINPANSLLLPFNIDDGDDDLAIFGGQTRVLSRRSRHKRTALSASNISTSDSPSPVSSGSSTGAVETNDLAPLTSAAPTDVQSTNNTMGIPSPFQGSCGGAIPVSLTTSNSSKNAPDSAMDLSLDMNDVGSAPVPQSSDMFANLMGHIASRPAESPATGPSKLSMYQFAQGLQGFPDLQEWRGLSPDPNGLPKPDTSFNWSPPSHHRAVFGQQQQQLPQVSLSPSPAVSAMYNQTTSTHQILQDPPIAQHTPPPPPYPDGHRFLAGYQAPLVSTGYDSSANMVTDQTETLLELGLMRGSEIDSGWLSFMQDCGIMDNSSDPSLLSSTPLPAP